MIVRMHAQTDTGRRRNHNEDCVGITPAHGIAVLADGMGGYNAGEIASAMAVEWITDILRKRLNSIDCSEIDDQSGFTLASVLVRDAIRNANEAICTAAQQQRECSGMGTTVLVALFYEDRLTAAHIGDSRMYRLRGGELSHVTEDHSVIHEQVRRGLVSAADARNSMIKNLVTRALGSSAGVEPDLVEDFVEPGDLYMMCSDGLTDVVSDEEIRELMAGTGKNLAATCQQLIDKANAAGGPDNISVIMIRTDESSRQGGGFFSRLFGK